MKRLTEGEALKFKTLAPEEKTQKGILGRLYGPVASCVNPTRNGRKYSESLWENLFKSDLIKERFASGGIFGQLCHPDYEEIDMEKIAVVMPEPPQKDQNGQLVAYVDILDTPCGRIAYQLAKYGYKFGISSRGTGDLIDGPEGEEVDPETYQLNAFDLVEIPAVQTARLQFVESLDKKKYNKTLRERLNEELANTDDKGKQLMTEALSSFGITLDEAFDPRKVTAVLNAINDGIEDDTDVEALANYLQQIVGYCQDIASDYDIALNSEIEEDMDMSPIRSQFANVMRGTLDTAPEAEALDFEMEFKSALNEVFGEAKECNSEDCTDIDGKEEVVNDKSEDDSSTIMESIKQIKQLTQDNLSLQEKLSVCNAKEAKLEEDLKKYKQSTVHLGEQARLAKQLSKQYTELEGAYTATNEKLTEALKQRDEAVKVNNQKLNESVETATKLDEALATNAKLISRIKALKTKMSEGDTQLAKYQKELTESKNRYMAVAAEAYGIDSRDLKRNLKESYSLKDIDSVCKKLAERKQRLNSLPFSINENTRMTITPRKETLGPMNDDDDVTDLLLQLTDY